MTDTNENPIDPIDPIDPVDPVHPVGAVDAVDAVVPIDPVNYVMGINTLITEIRDSEQDHSNLHAEISLCIDQMNPNRISYPILAVILVVCCYWVFWNGSIFAATISASILIWELVVTLSVFSHYKKLCRRM